MPIHGKNNDFPVGKPCIELGSSRQAPLGKSAKAESEADNRAAVLFCALRKQSAHFLERIGNDSSVLQPRKIDCKRLERRLAHEMRVGIDECRNNSPAAKVYGFRIAAIRGRLFAFSVQPLYPAIGADEHGLEAFSFALEAVDGSIGKDCLSAHCSNSILLEPAQKKASTQLSALFPIQCCQAERKARLWDFLHAAMRMPAAIIFPTSMKGNISGARPRNSPVKFIIP